MGEAGAVYFAMVIHHHQPVGNFDHVMSAGREVAYAPFLEALERHPAIPVALHVSGPLLRWLERSAPGDIDRMAALVDRGQLEVIGGGFYEPIFPLIPHRDRVGQVREFADHLETLFGRRPRGLWLPERVWESALVTDLAEAGVEYTFVDDSLFKAAGLDESQLHGYYLTEDLGQAIKIFPICERLRYLIPFHDPREVLDYFGSRRPDRGAIGVLYGDDGEKFGMWPGTHRLVWEERWMDRFFEALESANGWLRLTHPSGVVEALSPTGKIYLPDGSYREMMEWTLPEHAHARCKALTESLERQGDHDATALVRAGAYRNFRARYDESNRLYSRMLRVSRKVAALGDRPEAAAVREDLYQGQCNCAYWHGVFGGLYMPHLRAAVQRHLIRAEAAADRIAGRDGVEVDVDDYDLDGNIEVLVATPAHDVVIRAAGGGHLTVWNHREKLFNLQDVLTRRPEVYHKEVANAVVANQAEGGCETIHGRPRARELGLELLVRYDRGVRASLVDRFLPLDVPAADPADPEFEELGDAWNGAYERLMPNGDRPGIIRLARETRVQAGAVRATLSLEKTIQVHHDPRITVDYVLRPALRGVRFGVEFSLGIPTHLGPRYLRLGEHGEAFGLDSLNRVELEEAAHFVDEDLGIHFVLTPSRTGTLRTYPIYTVSNSEQGFEKTFQGLGVLLDFAPAEEDEQALRLDLELR